MTEREIIEICTVFSGEVHNGGFLQFLYNDSGAYTKHITQCLTRIGAAEAADICQSALSVLPSSLPDDPEQRRGFLSETLTPETVQHLERCDKRFYEVSGQLDSCLDRFIDLHFPDDPMPSDDGATKDYVALFQKLEARTAASWDDLDDPKLRRRHNKAMTEIHKLKLELFAKADKGAPVILKLLQSENPRMRITAGAYCLEAQILQELGKHALAQIAADTSLSRMLRFEAESCIKYCRPFQLP